MSCQRLWKHGEKEGENWEESLKGSAGIYVSLSLAWMEGKCSNGYWLHAALRFSDVTLLPQGAMDRDGYSTHGDSSHPKVGFLDDSGSGQ